MALRRPPALSAAEHEAAHCVIGLELGIIIKNVRVRRNGRDDWTTETESLQEHKAREPGSPYDDLVRSHVLQLMAGSAIEFTTTGEEAFFGRRNRDDWKAIYAMLNEELRLGRERLEEERQALWAQALRLVKAHRGAIDLLTRALQVAGELSASEIHKVLRSR